MLNLLKLICAVQPSHLEQFVTVISFIQLYTPESIRNAVSAAMENSHGKLILASGCEVPKGTPVENYRAFYEAASSYN